ncbi:MAG TPA: prolyl oligopeptidase family serine peptidase [Xanthomonadales bacterium]|nr:prolyl oligopeptidase family serine peptidase [Xanthomonadales bacterium]
MFPALLSSLALLAGLSQVPSAEVREYAREPVASSMALSPDGAFVAMPERRGDRSVLAIRDARDLSLHGTVDEGPNSYVERFWWSSPRRVFVTLSEHRDGRAQRSMRPELLAFDADGTHRTEGRGVVLDTLADDERDVLMMACRDDGCDTGVSRVDSYDFARGAPVANLPYPATSILADARGRVRFAWGSDDADDQRVFFRPSDEDEWELVNDERESGVEWEPLLVARDGATAWIRSQFAKGPDGILAFDLRKRTTRVALRHPRVDPAEYILSADARDFVGAWFLDGSPQPRFLDADAPAARLARAIATRHPGEFARVMESAEDGSRALVVVSSDHAPPRFELYERASDSLRPISAAAGLHAPRPARPVSFRARDGLRIAGQLVLPRGDGPFPLVLNPHGGPYGVIDAWGYDGLAQLLASRGYAVLKVDFRGSGGRGRAFEQAGLREWGARMQDDLADAVHWAVAQGHADPARVCIAGASYGGYAALMGAARDRGLYACAVGESGVYDLALMHRAGDIRDTEYGRHYLERAIGTDPRELARRSPVTQAARIDVPVLLAWGDRDERVSPAHSRAMRAALRRAGNDPATFHRRNEGHGFFDEGNRAEWYATLVAFLDAHIGPKKRT